MGSDVARVLVVDDEPAVLGRVRAILTNRGYVALAAESPAAALAHFAERGHEIDMVAADITMPVMSGPEMVRRILERRPDLPVVFMTGYSPATDLGEEVSGAPQAFHG